MGLARSIGRTAYFISRTAGDIDAAQRGRLHKRLARRWVTRAIFRAFR